MKSVAVVVDYQNMHLTGHGQFCPEGLARHKSLVHPLHLGNQILLARANRMRSIGNEAPETTELSLVAVYRGLPTNKEQPDHYRRSLKQQSEWTRDRRIEVNYRPLKYNWKDGVRVAQEKGVDVLVALRFVALVQAEEHDVVILAAHDTDLEPALEFALESDAVQSGRVKVETAGWAQCKRLRPRGGNQWHTFMTGEYFVRSRDRKDYSIPMS